MIYDFAMCFQHFRGISHCSTGQDGTVGKAFASRGPHPKGCTFTGSNVGFTIWVNMYNSLQLKIGHPIGQHPPYQWSVLLNGLVVPPDFHLFCLAQQKDTVEHLKGGNV